MTTTNKADTDVPPPYSHGPEYVNFFKQRRWPRAAFEKQFPHLDYCDELEQVAGGPFSKKIKEHARQILSRMRAEKGKVC